MPSTRLDDLAARWEESRRQGQEVSAAELCRECPELLPELERYLGDTGAMPTLAPIMDDSDSPPTRMDTGDAAPSVVSLVEVPVGARVPGSAGLGVLGRG